MKYTASTLH